MTPRKLVLCDKERDFFKRLFVGYIIRWCKSCHRQPRRQDDHKDRKGTKREDLATRAYAIRSGQRGRCQSPGSLLASDLLDSGVLGDALQHTTAPKKMDVGLGRYSSSERRTRYTLPPLGVFLLDNPRPETLSGDTWKCATVYPISPAYLGGYIEIHEPPARAQLQRPTDDRNSGLNTARSSS